MELLVPFLALNSMLLSIYLAMAIFGKVATYYVNYKTLKAIQNTANQLDPETPANNQWN